MVRSSCRTQSILKDAQASMMPRPDTVTSTPGAAEHTPVLWAAAQRNPIYAYCLPRLSAIDLSSSQHIKSLRVASIGVVLRFR